MRAVAALGPSAVMMLLWDSTRAWSRLVDGGSFVCDETSWTVCVELSCDLRTGLRVSLRMVFVNSVRRSSSGDSKKVWVPLEVAVFPFPVGKFLGLLNSV